MTDKTTTTVAPAELPADRPAPATPGTIAHHIGAFCFVNSVTHDDLAQQLGLESGAIIRQVAAGRMVLPLTMVEPLAEVLEVDKFELLSAWLREHHPALHGLFEELRLRCDITPAEQRLLAYCRELAGDRDAAPVVIDGRSVVALLVR